MVRRRLKQFYAQFVRPRALCFDIGAHLGNRTRAFLDLGARVVAVEPQPVCLSYLRKKFHGISEVEIVPLAISAQSGSVELKISRLYPTISTAAGEDWQQVVREAASYPISWEETVSVESITLDQLIDKYGEPEFCKIDVEGLEAEVLAGLSRPINALSFEFFRETSEITRRCIDRLEQLGHYNYNWSKGESQKMEYQEWQTGAELLSSLNGLPHAHLSGDIYARLIRNHPSQQ